MFEILVSLFFQEYLEHIQAYQFFYTELPKSQSVQNGIFNIREIHNSFLYELKSLFNFILKLCKSFRLS
ncbi:Uncharacterised protein [Klebsiella pneumoniae]|uniref:Uncharacterized protein n=1 Tax=Klebsiella pneumoniae TaxID=573 RepID=A0A377ZI88_KLEPN|nr:Uncharacterised protein [Klebsiella pneumoniae]